MKIGDKKTLKATLSPDYTTDKLKWSSSNKKIAKVSSTGEITALSVGSAKITAKCGKKKAVCKVTVKQGSPISDPILGTDKSIYSYCVGYGFGFTQDSVNGIKLCWQGKNNTGKKINYYTVHMKFINAVGDPAYDEITGESTYSVKYVGPVKPGENLIVYSIVGYVPVCNKVKITTIDLEFADGTTQTVTYNKTAKYFYK
jgi:hypothetical protein